MVKNERFTSYKTEKINYRRINNNKTKKEEESEERAINCNNGSRKQTNYFQP